MKKTIVVFSNPFGYGPTGKAIAIARAFIDSGYKDVIFAGSSLVQEIVPSSFNFYPINERNEKDIKDFLLQIKNPVVIGSQNRFVIKVAKSLGIKSAFLDGLSWFWDVIPLDHLIADEIFWMRYPKMEEKIPKGLDNIHIVSAIVDTKTRNKKPDQILIHLGGCRNPLVDNLPRYYIDMLVGVLPELPDFYKIKITGGTEALEYLKLKLPYISSNISISSLKHDEFIEELAKSAHFITTAGQSATLEAFAMGVPTSFILPTNQSQFALMNLLSKYDAAPKQMLWSDYLSEQSNIFRLNEKETIIKFDIYAREILGDKKLYRKFSKQFIDLVKSTPTSKEQNWFISFLGMDGAKMIKDILFKKWDLSL